MTSQIERAARIATLMHIGYPSRAEAWCWRRTGRMLRDLSLVALEEVLAQRCADDLAQQPDITPALDRRRDALRSLSRELRALMAYEAARE